MGGDGQEEWGSDSGEGKRWTGEAGPSVGAVPGCAYDELPACSRESSTGHMMALIRYQLNVSIVGYQGLMSTAKRLMCTLTIEVKLIFISLIMC